MMDVQVIGHQDYLFGCGINFVHQFLEYLGKIQFGALLTDPNSAESGQGFNRQKDGTFAMPLVFMVFSFGLTRFQRQ
jgi:hypothetical protein